MDDLDVALLVVLDGEDSEEEKHRRSESDLFKKRSIEGAYQILICRHLYTNENRFREYFRLTPALFDYVLGYIKEDLCSKPTNRVQNPLTPEQKLCLLLSTVVCTEQAMELPPVPATVFCRRLLDRMSVARFATVASRRDFSC
nr:unnamed protein product [Callosobruchus chinensis]